MTGERDRKRNGKQTDDIPQLVVHSEAFYHVLFVSLQRLYFQRVFCFDLTFLNKKRNVKKKKMITEETNHHAFVITLQSSFRQFLHGLQKPGPSSVLHSIDLVIPFQTKNKKKTRKKNYEKNMNDSFFHKRICCLLFFF